jgi:3D (Asp-Asp-Asp) domain-containing protein
VAILASAGVAMLLYATLLRDGGTPPKGHAVSSQCSLGVLRSNQLLLHPRTGTFYSIDALNPDVVAFGGKYLMYFSGNSVASATQPKWVTGLAVASRPSGPFRVDSSFRGNYLNGGTTQWRGGLWHLVEVVQGSVNELAESADGRSWHHVAWLPAFRLDGRIVTGADFSLTVEHKELVASMFLVQPRPLYSAFTIARVRFNGRSWRGFEPILQRDTGVNYEAYDIGEPYVFENATGAANMLYVATAADRVRSIAMAYRRHGHWARCANNPVIRAGAPWAKTIAIDPSVLRVGSATYVYYGGAANTGLGSDLGGMIGVASFAKDRR